MNLKAWLGVAFLSVFSGQSALCAAGDMPAQVDFARHEMLARIDEMERHINEQLQRLSDWERDRAYLPARVPVFFPPVPPPLNAPVDSVAPLYVPGWDAPVGLSAYVGEFFYTTLSTCLAEDRLLPADPVALKEFVTLREAALAGVRAELASLSLSGKRVASASVETKAEELRHHFARYDWNRYRTFRVANVNPKVPFAVARLHEWQVLRAATFFSDGIPVPYRTLLWELTCEPSFDREIASLPAARAEPGGVIWFLPAGSRIVLPTPLAEPVVGDLNEFLARKHRLKQAIAAEVLQTDELPRQKYLEHLAKFVDGNAANLADLEMRAEAIRRELAAIAPLPSAKLPPEVIARARDFRRRRAALQSELASALRAVRKEELTYKPGSEVLAFTNLYSADAVASEDIGRPVSSPMWLFETEVQAKRATWVGGRLQATSEAFAEAHRAEALALEAERNELFQVTARGLGLPTNRGEASGPDVSRTVMSRLEELAREDRTGDYADYATAVLRPGLNPADRRLLFNAALVALHLPLPAGVRRPVGRFEN